MVARRTILIVLLALCVDGFQRRIAVPRTLSRPRVIQTNVQPPVINAKESSFFPLSSLPLEQSPAKLQQALKVAEDVKQNEWVARCVLLAVSAFYGTNFGCVKILDQALDPSMAATFRFTLASLVFLPFLIKNIYKSPALIKGGLEVGVYLFFGYWAQAHSLLTSSASTAAFICSLAVIVVPLLDALSGKKSKTDAPWYAPLLPATLAAAGVGCLELGGSTAPGVGDLWAIVQPLAFGLGFWRVEAHMREAKKSDAPAGSTQAFTGAMMLTVAAFSWIWALFEYIIPNAHNLNLDGSAMTLTASLGAAVQTQLQQVSDWHVALAILWTGIVTTALTSYGENIAMKSLSSAETTVIFSTEPLWGTAFAAVALGESVGPNVFVGAALILSACVWSSLGTSVSLTSLTASAPIWVQELAENFEELGSQFRSNWDTLLGVGEVVQDIPLDEL